MRLLLGFFCWTLAAVLFFCAASGGTAAAQETADPARPAGAPAEAAPAAALRDILSAACAQDQKEFARFLTARNARSYARLTAAARVALMKRFVLLDENRPGALSALYANPNSVDVFIPRATFTDSAGQPAYLLELVPEP